MSCMVQLTCCVAVLLLGVLTPLPITGRLLEPGWRVFVAQFGESSMAEPDFWEVFSLTDSSQGHGDPAPWHSGLCKLP